MERRKLELAAAAVVVDDEAELADAPRAVARASKSAVAAVASQTA